jgi:two-component system sensor histidine kinase UhpB
MDLLVRMPLARQIFLVASTVLVAVTAALALLPVRISSPPGAADLATVLGALAVVLLTIYLALRRLLAPLHRLAHAMETVDPLRPDPGLREWVAPDDRDVDQLFDAFEAMLERFRVERLHSDRRTAAAQEAERRSVAGEIHDEIGQTLTALSLQLERATMDGDQRELAQRTVGRALRDVRSIAHRLRPEGLDDLGLVNALIALCVRVQDESGLPVLRDLDPLDVDLDPDVALALYRIAQEALTNAIRHAGATRVRVTLRSDDDGVTLRVADDGRGVHGPVPGVGGIAGMRERARLVHATLELQAGDPGTVVVCRRPPREAGA